MDWRHLTEEDSAHLTRDQVKEGLHALGKLYEAGTATKRDGYSYHLLKVRQEELSDEN